MSEIAPHFPQLELVDLVGAGGAGTVYRARQRTLNRTVALKVLFPQYTGEPEFASRFEREARALASLAHPHIVMVHDAGRAGPYLFLLMEFVDGANLRALLRNGKIAPRQALSIAGEICAALQYAHDFGVVHRDIKPENVLVDTKGRVKIADFGLAKLIRPEAAIPGLTTSHQVMGTPQYMAPEQIERPSAVDHRADLYALGVVLYELLTGELPLGRFDVPSHKAAVDTRLDAIVLRALEKDRDRRYQRASEIQTDVEAIVHGGEPRREVSPGPVAPAIRWREGTPLLVGNLSPQGGRRVTLVAVGPRRGEILRALCEICRCPRKDAERALAALPLEVAARIDNAHAQWIRMRLEAFEGEVEIA